MLTVTSTSSLHYRQWPPSDVISSFIHLPICSTCDHYGRSTSSVFTVLTCPDLTPRRQPNRIYTPIGSLSLSANAERSKIQKPPIQRRKPCQRGPSSPPQRRLPLASLRLLPNSSATTSSLPWLPPSPLSSLALPLPRPPPVRPLARCHRQHHVAYAGSTVALDAASSGRTRTSRTRTRVRGRAPVAGGRARRCRRSHTTEASGIARGESGQPRYETPGVPPECGSARSGPQRRRPGPTTGLRSSSGDPGPS